MFSQVNNIITPPFEDLTGLEKPGIRKVAEENELSSLLSDINNSSKLFATISESISNLFLKLFILIWATITWL